MQYNDDQALCINTTAAESENHRGHYNPQQGTI
jgi:hypothetical protein